VVAHQLGRQRQVTAIAKWPWQRWLLNDIVFLQMAQDADCICFLPQVGMRCTEEDPFGKFSAVSSKYRIR
jgi:hypothetical protein